MIERYKPIYPTPNQVILLNGSGLVFESCDELVKTSHLRARPVNTWFSSENMDWEKALDLKSLPQTFKKVHNPAYYLEGDFDFYFVKCDRTPGYIVWIICDRTAFYKSKEA